MLLPKKPTKNVPFEGLYYSSRDFHPVTCSCPKGGTWWCWGGGGQKFYFLNMVMWHIKLKGMLSRPGCSEKFYPRIKLATLCGVKRSNTISFFESVGICDGAPSNVF